MRDKRTPKDVCGEATDKHGVRSLWVVTGVGVLTFLEFKTKNVGWLWNTQRPLVLT